MFLANGASDEWCFLWMVFLNNGVPYKWCFLWMVFLKSTVNGLPYEWCCVGLMVSLHYQWWSFESLNRLWLVFLISGVPYEWFFLWMLFRKSTVTGRPYVFVYIYVCVCVCIPWFAALQPPIKCRSLFYCLPPPLFTPIHLLRPSLRRIHRTPIVKRRLSHVRALYL